MLAKYFSEILLKNSLTKVIFGLFLLASLAQIQIPLKPVPITFHTVGAILIGLLYSPKDAILSWISYFILGAFCNIPIFTNFSYGIEKLLGPSAGYYYGMMISSCVIAIIIQKFKVNLSHTINLISMTLLAQIIIYIVGVSILSMFIGINNAVYSGFIIFIPSGIIKTIALTILFRLTYENNN